MGRDGVARLLSLRPDLAEPPAPSVGELAIRAVHPVSLSLALRSFDVPTLQVAEVLAALGRIGDGGGAEGLLGIDAGDAGGPAREALDRSLEVLRAFLFLGPDEPRLLPEIAAAWPAPLGLGPPVRTILEQLPVASLRQGMAALGVRTPKTLKAHLVEALAEALSEPAVVRAALDGATPAVAERITQAALGRPLPYSYLAHTSATTSTRGAAQDPTLWAVRHLLAFQSYTGVVMPAEVALALRGPGWHVDFDHRPPPVVWVPRAAQVLDRGAAAAVGNAVRAVTALLEALGARPAQRLKSGAMGVRELRRLAKDLALGVAEVRLALAVAHDADLIAPTDDGVAPTRNADAWLRSSPTARATALLDAWAGLAHLPMLAPEGIWYPHVAEHLAHVRAVLLATLIRHPGQAVDPASLTTLLDWSHPVVLRGRLSAITAPGVQEQAGAPDDDPDDPYDDPYDPYDDPETGQGPDVDGRTLVDVVLAEAAWTGVVADGALTPLGAALLAQDRAGLATTLDGMLGADATTAHLQADLTAVVMGHPAAELAAVLDELADRESRSVAATWRFSPAGVRRALDAGWDADRILTRLAGITDGPVPQPLTYLVHDVARRHGHLRGGAVLCYLRGDDPALLREVVADRRLAGLGLRLVADGVLVGERPLEETLTRLRDAGYAPVEEGADGRSVLTRRTPVRADKPTGRGHGRGRPDPGRGRRPRRS